MEVYTGVSPSSKVYAYSATELIPRQFELDEDQAPGFRFDNGDDNHIDADPNYYFSKPSQSGSCRIIVGVNKSDAKNKALRYNFHYLTTIEVTTNSSSYDNGNQTTPDILDLLQKALQENILLILFIIVLNIAMSVIPYLGVVTAAKFDLMVIGFMFAEIVVFGKLGGFTETQLYEDFGLLRFAYDWILDWDGSAARVIVNHEQFNFLTMRWY